MVALENTHGTEASALLDTDAHICGWVSPPCKIDQTSKQTDVECLISGTYIHLDLVPSVVGWGCPEFQIKANTVVNAFLTKVSR